MNNNLSENLKKIRKDNHLSQEQLAEELGVSRQAISKWESGVAYPEMEKIIQLCDKFDLKIDDLLHKDIRETKGEEISKNNLNKYIDGFLNFITDTVNLFSNMNFKSKIKCLLEQGFISAFLFLIACIVGFLCNQLVSSLLPYEGYLFIEQFLESIYIIFAVTVSFVILVHIFKTRYLDYYSKIKNEWIKVENKKENAEDSCEKKVMKDKDSLENINNENKIVFSRNEDKIIIRDSKHSEYRFINGLFKMIILGIKFFAFLGLLFFCFILVSLLIGFVMSFTVFKTGLFFIGLLLSFLSVGVIDIVIIIVLLNFIFNRKNDKKKMIWSFITALVVAGIGCGMIFLGILKFDVINKNSENNEMMVTKTLNLEMDDTLFFNDYNEIKYIEENIDYVKFEYKINKVCEIEYSQNEKYGTNIWGYCSNPMAMLRQYISNINDKKIIDITNDIMDIKVYASKDNLEKLQTNYKKYHDELQSYQSMKDYYEEKIDAYKNEITELQNEIYELKEKKD